jgi:hypothetical protein
MHIFLLKIIALCCYLRIFSLLILFFSTSMQWHGLIIDAFMVSMCFDFLSRYPLVILCFSVLSFYSRVFCYWLYGSSEQLDYLSSSLSSLGDRLSYFSISLSCLLSLYTSSFRSFPIPIQITPVTALLAPSLTSMDSSLLIVILSGTMVLEIASSWMYLTAEV